eukprot:SAG22_NODE_1380_length_4545_cov_1.918129_1_plen_107_part_00
MAVLALARVDTSSSSVDINFKMTLVFQECHTDIGQCVTNVRVSDSGLTGDVGKLAALTGLTSLAVDPNTQVSGSVEPLKALTQLTELTLSKLDVSGSVEPLRALHI